MLRHILAAGSNLSSQVMSPSLSTNETFDLRRPICRRDKGKDRIIETYDNQVLTRLEISSTNLFVSNKLDALWLLNAPYHAEPTSTNQKLRTLHCSLPPLTSASTPFVSTTTIITLLSIFENTSRQLSRLNSSNCSTRAHSKLAHSPLRAHSKILRVFYLKNSH